MHVDSLPRHDPDLLFKRVSIYFHGISAAVLRDSWTAASSLPCRSRALGHPARPGCALLASGGL